MKIMPLLFVAVLLTGCASHRDDTRLQGTWVLNCSATAEASSKLPPHKVFVTYSHGAEIVKCDEEQYGNWNVAFHYHVVEHGSNYIVIRTTAPVDKRRRIHIRFVDDDCGYWIDTGPLGYGIQERFDKLQTKPLPPGMGGVIVPSPIQLDW